MSTQPCLLSAFEGDSRTGLGHRLEATLSCIGVAQDLDNTEFIWTPLTRPHAHGLNHHTFNAFFNLHRAFRTLSPPLVSVPRTPVPPLASGGGVSNGGGSCTQSSWMLQIDQNPSSCMRDGTSVHSGDSCWDRFW